MSGLVVGVTGSTGHLGGLLLAELLSDPGVAEVRSVARRPLAGANLFSGPIGHETGSTSEHARLVHVQADLTDELARRSLSGVDLLYHLGAQVWRGRGPAGLGDMYRANVGGTQNVLSAQPGAVVFASSASVYGAWPDNPVPMDEDHVARPNPECEYAQQKLLGEQLCLGCRGSAKVAVVRLGAVLGPHADARVARSLQGYRLAVPAVRGVVQAVQWVEETDAVAALLAAGRALTAGGTGGMGNGNLDGEVVNAASTDWLNADQMAAIAGSRVVNLPSPVLMRLSELGRRLRLAPFGADRAALIGGPLAMSSGKAQRLLGWVPKWTSAQVFEAAIARGALGWRSQPRNRQ
ncbi:MAG: NAD-dependent epimerase/dehydratase family protein [Acidimicrobiales bacterium]